MTESGTGIKKSRRRAKPIPVPAEVAEPVPVSADSNVVDKPAPVVEELPDQEMSIKDISCRRHENFSERIRRSASEKVCLGIDVGTKCGYALTYVDKDFNPQKMAIPVYGIWDLSSGPYDSGALRLHKLRQFLEQVSPDLVGVEGSPMQMGSGVRANGKVLGVGMTAQAFLAALRGVIAEWCESRGVPHTHIPVSRVKKHATGSGNANKIDVIRAANSRFGFGFPEDDKKGWDNVADASFVLSSVVEDLYQGFNFSETQTDDGRKKKESKKAASVDPGAGSVSRRRAAKSGDS